MRKGGFPCAPVRLITERTNEIRVSKLALEVGRSNLLRRATFFHSLFSMTSVDAI